MYSQARGIYNTGYPLAVAEAVVECKVKSHTILVVTTQFDRPEPTVCTFSKKLQPFIVWVRGITISYWYYVFGSKVEIE